ncbi:MAG: phosphoenolpyruvate carboxylase [Pseudomonadales bacterium]|nr:phosphoenolpyruvate carboxylase [Pseudomonadales bacterium]
MPNSHPHLHQSLRKDVRLLGRLLGEEIGHDRGPELVEDIENIRKLAKDARRGNSGEWEVLSNYLAAIPAGKITDIANAFSQFLNLANIAEQHHQIRLQHVTNQIWPRILSQLKDTPSTPGEIREALLGTRIEVVLTAHPTELLRRTHILKYNAIAAELNNLDQQNERQKSNKLLRRLVSEAWHTAEVRNDRPSPQEEARWGFAVVENSLWEAIPKLYQELDEAFCENDLEPIPTHACLFKFASWMGGDRDGNPNVTASVTREVLMLARWMAADLFLRDLTQLQGDLSMRECSPALRKKVGKAQEPYRELIKEIHARMERTRDWAALLDPTPPSNQDDIFLFNEDLNEMLVLCHQSLIACGMELIANGPLLDTLRRVACFGLQLVDLDIRQQASSHSAVLDEVTRYLEILINNRSYARWTEKQRQNFLLEELDGRRPLFPSTWPISEASQEVLDTFSAISVNSSHGVSGYVISCTSTPSDVLAVLLLLQQAGLKESLPVIPSFECIEDVHNAAETLDKLLSLPWYKTYLQTSKCGQQIMISYSDLAMDVGPLAAAWIEHQAQEQLLAVAHKHTIELTFFHGRGGVIGRGGTQAHEAIMSLPPGSVSSVLRLTEQGEMIRFKLGLPDLAVDALGQYLAAALSARLSPPASPKPEWREKMDDMALAAQKSYRSLVNNNDYFMEFFRDLTPAQELSILPLGSQPSSRSLSSDIHQMQALPWMFAWTQVRLMLPAWLGTEDAIHDIIESDTLIAERKMMHWPFYKTQIDILENILIRTDISLVRYYAQRLTMKSQQNICDKLCARMEQLLTDVLTLNGEHSLLEEQPEILEAINVRNTYLDPLHLLQAELLDRLRLDEGRNESVRKALQLTMAGISSGLRNSG